MCPIAGLDRCKKSRPQRYFFVLFFFLSVLLIHYVPLYPLYSCHLFLYNTQHKHPCLGRDFLLSFSLFVLYLFFFRLSALSWFFLPFALNVQHNTNIHAAGGIRTHNHSKRAATDLRSKAHSHWNRLFDPRTVQPVASRYTD